MKEVYNTCMDESAIKAYGTKPLEDILNEFNKVFPREGKPVYTELNDELTKTVTWLLKHSVSGLVSVDTGVSF